jgi:hypothetical protein
MIRNRAGVEELLEKFFNKFTASISHSAETA